MSSINLTSFRSERSTSAGGGSIGRGALWGAILSAPLWGLFWWGVFMIGFWQMVGAALGLAFLVLAAFQPVLAPKYGLHNVGGWMEHSGNPDPFRPGQDPRTRGE